MDESNTSRDKMFFPMLKLPTELQIRILAYLGPIDSYIHKRTCAKFNDILTHILKHRNFESSIHDAPNNQKLSWYDYKPDPNIPEIKIHHLLSSPDLLEFGLEGACTNSLRLKHIPRPPPPVPYIRGGSWCLRGKALRESPYWKQAVFSSILPVTAMCVVGSTNPIFEFRLLPQSDSTPGKIHTVEDFFRLWRFYLERPANGRKVGAAVQLRWLKGYDDMFVLVQNNESEDERHGLHYEDIRGSTRMRWGIFVDTENVRDLIWRGEFEWSPTEGEL